MAITFRGHGTQTQCMHRHAIRAPCSLWRGHLVCCFLIWQVIGVPAEDDRAAVCMHEGSLQLLEGLCAILTLTLTLA
jgi:hypothetical protein